MKTQLLSLLLGVGLLAGCSAFDAKLDCDNICDRYRSCYDTNYNVSGCSDRCQDRANNEDDYDRRVDICDACIDGVSCGQATFECAADCVSVVP